MRATGLLRRRPLTCAAGALALACTVEVCETIKGTGAQTSEIRPLAAFEEVEVHGNLDVTVQVEGEPLVAMHGYENLFEYVESRLEGRRLVLSVRDGCRLDPPPRLTVLVPDLTDFDLAGSGAVAIVNARGERLGLGIRGSGDLVCDGEVQNLVVHITGSGDMDLFNLVASEVQVCIKGSGKVRTTAHETLLVDLEGSCDVIYRGEPKTILRKTRGRSAVRPDVE